MLCCFLQPEIDPLLQPKIDRQQAKLLPVEYFMVTFTLPYELRALTWYHQKDVYNILFSCVSGTLRDFGLNPKNIGAKIGMTVVLHTKHVRIYFYKINLAKKRM